MPAIDTCAGAPSGAVILAQLMGAQTMLSVNARKAAKSLGFDTDIAAFNRSLRGSDRKIK